LIKYVTDAHEVRALGFCITQEHAAYMAEKFRLAGFKADYLVANKSVERDILRKKLISKDINYLFVVDIYNEGIDIPEIDTVLFLRPTESLTVFLQQLGRGLRLADGKECLTVLDFVGNQRAEYDFETKFRALVGKTATSITKEIEDDFPHLPLGCSVILEKVAKDAILNNIRKALDYSRLKLINKIRNFRHETSLPLSLKNFIDLYHIPLQIIYRRGGWSLLCSEAGILAQYAPKDQSPIIKAIQLKWISTRSKSYFEFILLLARKRFEVETKSMSELEKAFCLMLHYDVWQNSDQFSSLDESMASIGQNSMLVDEIIEVISLLLDRIDFMEHDAGLKYSQPLKLHSRYTRDQILSAFRFSTFVKKRSIFEGVAFSKELNTELLFITLNKSDVDFSPTTMYEDYAISDELFHWQSQNAISPDTLKGRSYINHVNKKKQILLFVRERNNDEFGNTMSYVFLGRVVSS
jgi:hypothetical protein